MTAVIMEERADTARNPEDYNGQAAADGACATAATPSQAGAAAQVMTRRDRQRRRRRNRGSPLGRVIALGLVLIVCVAVLGGLAIAGWVVNVAHSAPNLTQVHPRSLGAPTRIYSADGQLMGTIYSPDIHLQSDSFPTILKQATVATEDRRFYHHGALDYQGIIRAAFKDALHGSTALQGASTLTMQLVDNRYLPAKYKSARAQRDLKYKIVQAKLAEQLEAKHSKNWILDGYLNYVPYGTVYNQTAYGAAAASQMFFDKPVSKLNLVQAALLAGLPQAPTEYNPFVDPGPAKTRRFHVLASMVRAGYITQAQANRANRAPLEVKHDVPDTAERDPYVFNYIEQQALQDLCPRHPTLGGCPPIASGGLKIYSTINLQTQAQATAAIADHASLLASAGAGTGSGLASVDDSNGHILAIATSGEYSQTKIDYATGASRQTGSAFKVFALMTLIHDDDGNPSSTYYTSKPLAAGWYPGDPTWSVHTDDYKYNGTINITNATWLSDNTVYAQLVVDLGPSKMDEIAREMGITSYLDGDPAEVLGGLKYGTTPLQMADAYATIANGGVHHAPTIIDRIVYPDGSSNSSYGNPPATRVFSYPETYAADQVLKQVLTHVGATGTQAYYNCPAAGKTGTADNYDNAWFVGYNPKVSSAVWVGNPASYTTLNDGFGGTLAAPIWRQYMLAESDGYCGDWTPPTTPFVGKPYVGAHSSSSEPSTPYGEGGYGTATTPAPGTSTSQSATATTPSGGATGTGKHRGTTSNGGAGVAGLPG